MADGLLGAIHTPGQGNRHVDGATWCADNGAYTDAYPGDDKWFAWLIRHADKAATCAFAVAPDVVGDAQATLARSMPWLPKIRRLGYPAALAAQDGIAPWFTPWPEFDVLFIGGTTDWKLGPDARAMAQAAKRHGKWIHLGRVNSAKRLRYAATPQHLGGLGADSADGTYITFGPDTNLPKTLGWLRAIANPLDLTGDHQ